MQKNTAKNREKSGQGTNLELQYNPVQLNEINHKHGSLLKRHEQRSVSRKIPLPIVLQNISSICRKPEDKCFFWTNKHWQSKRNWDSLQTCAPYTIDCIGIPLYEKYLWVAISSQFPCRKLSMPIQKFREAHSHIENRPMINTIMHNKVHFKSPTTYVLDWRTYSCLSQRVQDHHKTNIQK